MYNEYLLSSDWLISPGFEKLIVFILVKSL